MKNFRPFYLVSSSSSFLRALEEKQRPTAVASIEAAVWPFQAAAAAPFLSKKLLLGISVLAVPSLLSFSICIAMNVSVYFPG